nr:odorant receptor 47 [Papilio machaon]
MTSLVGTVNSTLRIPLTLFLVLGLWAPNHFQGLQKWLFNIYTFFSYMFLVGIDIAVQLGDLYQVWGNVPLMTATMFLIFTNLALSGKLINIVLRKTQLQTIIAEVKEELDAESSDEGIKVIKSCNRETTIQYYGFVWLSYITILGLAVSTEKNQLPLRAWYPYDVSKTPAYEIMYTHQCIALLLASALNVSMDTLVTSLICQCRCRLRLLALSLTTLCDNALVENKSHVSCNEEVVMSRLRKCIQRHQAALEFARHLQLYFSAPIFGQFLVSALIICVTAYQLAFESSSLLRFFTMVSCLLDMTLEVFLYCYHGNELLHESENIKEAAYACPWYYCSIPVRRMLLLLITRSYRLARLRAGGFTELSLTSFMGIIKASYTFFTVLQQVEE